MSRKANPVTIGAFIVVTFGLAVVAIAFLATGTLFSPYSTYVSYFAESVNGLSVGAPVKYRGIQLGTVDRIGLFANEKGDFAEVKFRLDHKRMEHLGRPAEDVSEHNVAALVREGLRSRLEVESIVTGVVFVTLEIKEDAGPPVLVNPGSDVREIPTGPSPLSELTESAGEVIARLSLIDVKGMSDNLLTLTELLTEKLEGVQVDSLSQNLTDASARLRDILAESDVSELIATIDTTLDDFRDTNRNIQELMSTARPAVTRMDSIAASLQVAMEALSMTVEETHEMLTNDAEFRRSLEQAVSEMALAMRSFRRLANMLERNPRAIIAGKPEDRK